MQFHVQRNHILLPPGHSTRTPNDPCARRQLFWGRLSFAVAAGKLWMLAAGWSEDRWTVSPHSESMDTGPQSIGKGFLMSNAVRSTEGCGNWESPFFPIGPTELEPAIWGFYSKDKQGLYSVVLPINQHLRWTSNMCTIDLLGICLDQRYDPIRQSLDIQPAAAMKILALADSHDWRTTATRSMGHVKMIACLETNTQFSSTANWENHPREEAAELCVVLWCHCDCQLLLVSATSAKAAASKPEVGLGGDGRQYMGHGYIFIKYHNPKSDATSQDITST